MDEEDSINGEFYAPIVKKPKVNANIWNQQSAGVQIYCNAKNQEVDPIHHQGNVMVGGKVCSRAEVIENAEFVYIEDANKQAGKISEAEYSKNVKVSRKILSKVKYTRNIGMEDIEDDNIEGYENIDDEDTQFQVNSGVGELQNADKEDQENGKAEDQEKVEVEDEVITKTKIEVNSLLEEKQCTGDEGRESNDSKYDEDKDHGDDKEVQENCNEGYQSIAGLFQENDEMDGENTKMHNHQDNYRKDLKGMKDIFQENCKEKDDDENNKENNQDNCREQYPKCTKEIFLESSKEDNNKNIKENNQDNYRENTHKSVKEIFQENSKEDDEENTKANNQDNHGEKHPKGLLKVSEDSRKEKKDDENIKENNQGDIKEVQEIKQEELVLIICGKCHDVFYFLQEFLEHREASIECDQALKISLSVKEAELYMWSFLMWKRSQDEQSAGKLKKSTWKMYQEWLDMPFEVRDLWISSAQNLKQLKELGEAAKCAMENGTFGKYFRESEDEETERVFNGVNETRYPVDDTDSDFVPAKRQRAFKFEPKSIKNPDEYPFLNCRALKIDSKSFWEYVGTYKSNGEEKYIAEKILSKRFNVQTKGVEYQVKWHGHPNEENTWESADSTKDYPSIVKAYERKSVHYPYKKPIESEEQNEKRKECNDKLPDKSSPTVNKPLLKCRPCPKPRKAKLKARKLKYRKMFNDILNTPPTRLTDEEVKRLKEGAARIANENKQRAFEGRPQRQLVQCMLGDLNFENTVKRSATSNKVSSNNDSSIKILENKPKENKKDKRMEVDNTEEEDDEDDFDVDDSNDEDYDYDEDRNISSTSSDDSDDSSTLKAKKSTKNNTVNGPISSGSKGEGIIATSLSSVEKPNTEGKCVLSEDSFKEFSFKNTEKVERKECTAQTTLTTDKPTTLQNLLHEVRESMESSMRDRGVNNQNSLVQGGANTEGDNVGRILTFGGIYKKVLEDDDANTGQKGSNSLLRMQVPRGRNFSKTIVKLNAFQSPSPQSGIYKKNATGKCTDVFSNWLRKHINKMPADIVGNKPSIIYIIGSRKRSTLQQEILSFNQTTYTGVSNSPPTPTYSYPRRRTSRSPLRYLSKRGRFITHPFYTMEKQPIIKMLEKPKVQQPIPPLVTTSNESLPQNRRRPGSIKFGREAKSPRISQLKTSRPAKHIPITYPLHKPLTFATSNPIQNDIVANDIPNVNDDKVEEGNKPDAFPESLNLDPISPQRPFMLNPVTGEVDKELMKEEGETVPSIPEQIPLIDLANSPLHSLLESVTDKEKNENNNVIRNNQVDSDDNSKASSDIDIRPHVTIENTTPLKGKVTNVNIPKLKDLDIVTIEKRPIPTNVHITAENNIDNNLNKSKTVNKVNKPNITTNTKKVIETTNLNLPFKKQESMVTPSRPIFERSNSLLVTINTESNISANRSSETLSAILNSTIGTKSQVGVKRKMNSSPPAFASFKKPGLTIIETQEVGKSNSPLSPNKLKRQVQLTKSVTDRMVPIAPKPSITRCRIPTTTTSPANFTNPLPQISSFRYPSIRTDIPIVRPLNQPVPPLCGFSTRGVGRGTNRAPRASSRGMNRGSPRARPYPRNQPFASNRATAASLRPTPVTLSPIPIAPMPANLLPFRSAVSSLAKQLPPAISLTPVTLPIAIPTPRPSFVPITTPISTPVLQPARKSRAQPNPKLKPAVNKPSVSSALSSVNLKESLKPKQSNKTKEEKVKKAENREKVETKEKKEIEGTNVGLKENKDKSNCTSTITITGEDGQLYQVPNAKLDGNKIVVQTEQGEQQCLFVTEDGQPMTPKVNEDGSTVLTLDDSTILNENQKEQPIQISSSDITQLSEEGLLDTGGIEIELEEGATNLDNDEKELVAQLVEASDPSPDGGPRKVVLLLPDGNLLVTEVDEEQFSLLGWDSSQ